MELLKKAAEPNLKTDVPAFQIGDTVNVSVRIIEGDKERTQVFTGTVIGRRGSGISETFTVRRIVNNEGVERVFPIHSPKVSDIEVVRSGKTRRAKLYYLRDRVGKATRLREVRTGPKESGKAATREPEEPEETPEPSESTEAGGEEQ
jgi:large subunit ribosomal protein L19